MKDSGENATVSLSCWYMRPRVLLRCNYYCLTINNYFENLSYIQDSIFILVWFSTSLGYLVSPWLRSQQGAGEMLEVWDCWWSHMPMTRVPGVSTLSSVILGEWHYSASFHQRNLFKVRFQAVNRLLPSLCSTSGWPSIQLKGRR